MVEEFPIPTSWLTGITVIDQEHQHLFNMLMVIRELIKKGNKGLDPMVFSFVNHLHLHFQHEENYMQETGFEGATYHRIRHKKLLDSMLSILDTGVDRMRVINHALDVLFRDIIDDDLYLAEWVESRD